MGIEKRAESWREAMKFMARCPVCGKTYDVTKAKLLAQNGGANLVHIICKNCSSAFMAFILTMGNGLSSVGMITDLNFEDVKRLYKTEPLTLDELITVHELIKKDKLLNFLNP